MTFSDNGKGEPDLTPETSLVEDSSELVDDLRQLQTDAGLRPYRVFCVVVEWSGGELYRGESSVASEKEFLPTPLVDLRPMYSIMSEAGRFEHGDIVMREISPSLTEDQVNELCSNGAELGPNQQSFIEIRHDARKGNEPTRRRFVTRGVPWHNAEEFEWIVTLSDEDENRGRAGELPDKTLDPIRVFRPE
jgi:hypothetical protein